MLERKLGKRESIRPRLEARSGRDDSVEEPRGSGREQGESVWRCTRTDP